MFTYLIAHDIGTSGNKATLYTTDGELVKSCVEDYPTRYFNRNWAEQNPEHWWRAVCISTQQLLQGIDPNHVIGISFSGQMMGCVCVDVNGTPLRDAIIWADQRAEHQEQAIRHSMDESSFYTITGHRISSSYSIEKLMWLKEHEPDVYQNTYKMLNAKDYIVFKLTGEMVTDYSDASGTNAFDLHTFQWSEEILKAAGIDESKLPELKESTYVVGTVTSEAARETGLSARTSVVCGAGDGICAAVGAGSVADGITYNYIGSSSWIGLTSSKPILDSEMRTFNWAHSIKGKISPCGTMQSAGGSYQWLVNEMCKFETNEALRSGIDKYELVNRQIEQSPTGARGILYLPYLMGERSPRWNPDAKGAFIGLRMEHTRQDVYRSVLEGVTLNLNVILGVFRQYLDIQQMTVIGGAAQGNAWRQIMADIYNIEIVKPKNLMEATSMGAAVIAGVGVGALDNFDAIHQFIEIETIQRPVDQHHQIYQKMMPIFEEAYQALVEVNDKLSHL
ncbi:xylulokinase [Marinicrinis sediminis]|uniref:Xylulose kinase n=1 Tax=Marinicrinis sediminis TaxID=1652465 RepID=A0ABW5R9Y6_9BACL